MSKRRRRTSQGSSRRQAQTQPQLVRAREPQAPATLQPATQPRSGALVDAEGNVVRLSASNAPTNAQKAVVSQARTAYSVQSQSSAWQSASGQEAFYGGQPYPQMEQIKPTKPLLKSLGATGTAIFGGIITNEEYNEDFYWKDAVAIYEQMIRNDAQIFAVTQLLELPIRRATWSIEPASDDPRDKEIASFVESSLFHDMRYQTTSGRILSQKWDDILRHILMMLRFGFMAFEVCWRIEDGWVKWGRWTPLLPRTIWRWWIGEDNELAGVQQWTFKAYSYQFVDIPADKLLLFVHRQEGNNYEGVSVLRSAYKHWYYKDNYYKIEAIDIERNAVAIPVIHLPDNFTDDDITNAQNILANMRANEAMGVTLPPGWDIEYIRNMQRTTAQVQPSIQHHDVMIARNVLGQFLNLGSTETGAYNLNASQMAMFLAALQAECEYIEDVINSDAIPRLVDYNYDGVASYPRLKCGKLRSQDMDWLASALNKLANIPNNPLVHSDAELEDYIRNELGLPTAPASVVNTTNPSAPSTPERPENAERANDHEDAESQDVSGRTAPDGDAESGDANTAPGGTDSEAQSSAAASSAASTQASEAAEVVLEARLLREALAAAYADDPVEKGFTFSNPYPRQSHGRFGFFGFGPGTKAGGGGRGASGRGGVGEKRNSASGTSRTGDSSGHDDGGKDSSANTRTTEGRYAPHR